MRVLVKATALLSSRLPWCSPDARPAQSRLGQTASVAQVRKYASRPEKAIVPTAPMAPVVTAPSICAPSSGAPSFGGARLPGAPYPAPSFPAPQYSPPQFGAPSYGAPRTRRPATSVVQRAHVHGAQLRRRPPSRGPCTRRPRYAAPTFLAPVYTAPTYAPPTRCPAQPGALVRRHPEHHRLRARASGAGARSPATRLAPAPREPRGPLRRRHRGRGRARAVFSRRRRRVMLAPPMPTPADQEKLALRRRWRSSRRCAPAPLTPAGARVELARRRGPGCALLAHAARVGRLQRPLGRDQRRGVETYLRNQTAERGASVLVIPHLGVGRSGGRATSEGRLPLPAARRVTSGGCPNCIAMTATPTAAGRHPGTAQPPSALSARERRPPGAGSPVRRRGRRRPPSPPPPRARVCPRKAAPPARRG